ncbi:DUF222 domain-containing protein [Gordonia caeni]|uniref:HNH endonuclease signature motif containing protein n=1 Tax=Gordonia caeni TaxID=1007097 RepID=A0ABP7NI95_9ACTN
MVHIDRSSPWNRVDFSAAGMVAPGADDDEHTQCHDWLLYAASAHRGQAYLYWAQLHAIGEFIDIALVKLDDAVCAGGEQKDLFDPYTVAVGEVGILFAVAPPAARALVAQAVAASERLPKTADLLREGTISQPMFVTAVARTDIVDEPELVTAVDTDLAEALAGAGHISEKKAEKIADRVVTRHDRDAIRRRREKARKRKNVTNRDYSDGLGGVNVTADAEEARLALAAVNALAEGVCPNDPRTLGQRRSAAAIARLRGLPFTCACPDSSTCTATLGDQEISDRQARIIVHAVCQKSTLDGEDDEPGFLDGYGPISAEHARDLAQRPDATVRNLDLDDLTEHTPPIERPALIVHTSQPADPYRPNATLDALVRGLFATCTVAGCERPAWNCELDHVDEFDQICPDSGGPTCLCNIAPKCKAHHLWKTHLGADRPEKGWVDDLWIEDDGSVWSSVTLPYGITVEMAATNQWLFPQLAELRCLHQAQAPPEPPTPSGPTTGTGNCPTGGGLRAATAYKHAWRRAERARLRNERRRAAEAGDPPPF